MERNKHVLRDAEAMARVIAGEARWEGETASVWIAVFVGEVRCMVAEPPRRDSSDGQDRFLDDDLPF